MNNFDFSHDSLRRLDLNLLVAFDALMQERHVSRAAARLYLGQPAMSHALARLRMLLDDPLFVRSGNRMQPTARALQLAPAVRSWLQQAQQLLAPPGAFDPAAANASFRLAAPDGMEAMLYPPLIATLRRQAPGVQLRSQLLEIDQQLAALDNDEVDLLLTAAPLALHDWHSRLTLHETGFSAVYAPGQLTLPTNPNLADLARVDQVVSSYRGTAAGIVDHLFAQHGLQRHIVALSASLMAIGHILQQAPLLSIQPTLYLPLFRQQGDVRSVPLPADTSIRIDLVWHRRNDGNPLHRYLRDLLMQHFRQLFPPAVAVA